MDGRGPGVICWRRTGESGRGNEVRGRLPCGLGALAPGPTDALKSLGRLGVGGVKLVEFWVPFLRPAAGVGVIGIEPSEGRPGESRRIALATGKKMPAPGTFVEK
jgi:hypothetical protein